MLFEKIQTIGLFDKLFLVYLIKQKPSKQFHFYVHSSLERVIPVYLESTPI